jgi:hypothetical protein
MLASGAVHDGDPFSLLFFVSGSAAISKNIAHTKITKEHAIDPEHKGMQNAP